MRYCSWLGALLLLLCGALAGGGTLAYERRRCRQGEAFLSLMRHIRAQIDCFSTPLQGILANCDPAVWRDCGVSEPPRGLAELLRDAPLCMPDEACRLLFDAAARLGAGYREEQLRCCDYFLERLTPICDKMRRELPKRERLALLLPITAAAILVLLLI